MTKTAVGLVRGNGGHDLFRPEHPQPMLLSDPEIREALEWTLRNDDTFFAQRERN